MGVGQRMSRYGLIWSSKYIDFVGGRNPRSVWLGVYKSLFIPLTPATVSQNTHHESLVPESVFQPSGFLQVSSFPAFRLHDGQWKKVEVPDDMNLCLKALGHANLDPGDTSHLVTKR